VGTGLFGRVQKELEAREQCPGLTMADVLSLPDDLRRLVNWIVREGDVGLAQVSAFLEQDEANARATLASLIEKGFALEFEIHGENRYRVRLAPRRKHEVPLDIWQALDEKCEE
jgi:hypothetical protein